MFGYIRNEDKRLFEQLGRIAQYLSRSAVVLERQLASSSSVAVVLAFDPREFDTDGNGYHDVDVRAFTGFAMRLDPMEYRELAIALDAAGESVHEATAQVESLGGSDTPTDLRVMAHTLSSAAMALQTAVPLLGEAHDDIRLCISEIQRLAQVGEALYYHGVGALFAGTPDVMQVMRWKAIYEKLRHCLERCARGADVLDQLAHANA